MTDFIWTAADFPPLADPRFLDAIGHLVHARQAEGFHFSMVLAGYQALFHTADFMERLKQESPGAGNLPPPLHEVRQGCFRRDGPEGWEIRFRADIRLHNDFDPQTRGPRGKAEYASDLEYQDQSLHAGDADGLSRFRAWCRDSGVEC